MRNRQDYVEEAEMSLHRANNAVFGGAEVKQTHAMIARAWIELARLAPEEDVDKS